MNSLLPHEREFFLLRVITGVLRYGKLEIRTPTKQVLQRASDIYNRTYKKCLKKKIYSDQDALRDMIVAGVWTEDHQAAFDILPNRIEDYKLQMFENILRPTYQDKIRIHLDSCKKEYGELLQKRHKFDYLTAEGIAHFAKWQFIISNTTYFRGKKYEWDKVTQYTALDYYYKNMLTEDHIRDLARNQPWSSYWSSRETCGSLFGKPATEMSTDQIRLVYWSNLYENTYQQNDHDPVKLIEDNDVFDGWMISKSRERKTEQRVGFIKNQKIANSQEIFIAAKTKEEAKEINQMNTGAAKQNILNRFKRIKQEGEVKHHEFADVQQRRYEK